MMGREYGYGKFDGFRPYVSVAKRRAMARRHAEQLSKSGHQVQPIEISGRKIATTFWGQAWCDNLESYSDFANRLPRGRTYVRNGSVVDLQIGGGQVTAIVSGSEIYEVEIQINSLPQSQWEKIKRDCSQSIDSLIDLLQGRFSQGVMQRLMRQKDGLFPRPKEIQMRCSCPDWAVLCKHVAAVLYGVGTRLDTDPEMLFQLRQVDHLELISQAAEGANLDAAFASVRSDALEGQDLSDLFGIELDAGSADVAVAAKPARRRKATSSKATSSETARSPAKRRARGKVATSKKPATVKTGSASPKSATATVKKKAAARKRASSTGRPQAKKKTASKKKPATSPSRSAKKKAAKKK